MRVITPICLSALLLSVTCAAVAAPAVQQLPDQAWLDGAMKGLAKQEYHVSLTERGLQAPNRAQGFRSYFDGQGVRMVERTGAARTLLTLSLADMRRGDRSFLSGKAAPKVHHDAARVELRRTDVTEWYVNSEQGLEQGFDLSRRPDGDGRLELVLGVGAAKARMEGEGVALVSDTGRVMAYDKLKVIDADGRELSARFTVPASNRIVMSVDDHNARYPISIDPLLSTTVDELHEGDQANSELGAAVAGGGDFNADGFYDVVVGARYYDGGQTDEGAVFVYYGSASGLATMTSLTASDAISTITTTTPSTAYMYLGWAVASAGDLNGDSYDDLVVGAPFFSNGHDREGAVFVFYGGAGGVSNTPGARYEANQADTYFGAAVASAGDVNGDGYGDLIVGAPLYSNNGATEGAAFLFLGEAKTTLTTTVEGSPATADSRFTSDQGRSLFGYSVASAGDTDADGYDEIVIGAPGYNIGGLNRGAAFVYPGSNQGIVGTLPADAVAVISYNDSGSRVGASVAGLGDVNGDGYSDIAVGAPGLSGGVGGVMVYHGSPVGIVSESFGSSYKILLKGSSSDIGFGRAVAAAGDVNGDGFNDLVVGMATLDDSPTNPTIVDEGGMALYWGGYDGVVDLPIVFYSGQTGAQLGVSVGGGGDVNGDGFADIVGGAPFYDGTITDGGSLWVYYGGNGIQHPDKAVGNATRVPGPQAGAEWGVSVAAAGDVNGDGFDDVIIGAHLYDNGQQDEGAAFIFYGIYGGMPTGYEAVLEMNQVNAHMGAAVAGVGDVNDDGYADVIVGAPNWSDGQTGEGAAMLYLGSRDGIVTTAQAIFTSDQDGAQMGYAVAGADLNGDGYSDLIIGAPYYDFGQQDEGAVFVYNSSLAGPVVNGTPLNADMFLQSNVDSARFGQAVADAGDVNGDGYHDLLVGAPYYSNGQTDEGAAYAYYGSANGVQATPGAQYESDVSGARLGQSLAGVGDINGDGFSDIALAAPLYSGGNGKEGMVAIYHGSAGGLVSIANTVITGQGEFAEAGTALSYLGDINGDGYSDVGLGVYEDLGGSNTQKYPKVYIYLGSSTGIPSPAVFRGSADVIVVSDFGSIMEPLVYSGVGDVDGDGFNDLILGTSNHDDNLVWDPDDPTRQNITNDGEVKLYYSNFGNSGRAVATQQLRGQNDRTPVVPGGISRDATGFQVRMNGWHPATAGRVAMEVEVCPYGTAWKGIGCATHEGSWHTLTAAAPNVTLTESITTSLAGLSLSPINLYNWRARLKFLDDQLLVPSSSQPGFNWIPSGTSPTYYGPWRHMAAHGKGGDIRLIDGAGSLPNKAPLADAGTSTTVLPGAQVTLTGAGTDSDGSVNDYLWQQVGGSTVVLLNGDTQKASFYAPDDTVDTDYTFKLTVYDNDGASASDFVVITVSPPKETPTESTPTPTVSPIKSSSGGCSVARGAAFDPVLPVLVVFAGAYLGRLRRRVV